jgi:NADPH2:quinone reductase
MTPGIAGLSLETGARPVPGPGEVLVAVHAAALNFSDLLMIEDKYQVRPPRPFTPGQEVAGLVAEAGPGADLAVGQRIAGKILWGGFADYALMRADMALPLPETIDLAKAAALPVVYTTALVALTECAEIKPDDTVLIHAAAGGVGLACVQVAKAHGATVIATAGDAHKLAFARAQGADHALNYRDEDWISAVKDLTQGGGARLIVDPVGGDVAEQSLRCIARDGTLLIVGFASGTISRLPANRLLLRRAAAKGVYWSHDEDRPMLERVAAKMFRLLDNGAIAPVVRADYGLADLPRALADLSDRRSMGKLVLNLGSGERV